VALTTIYFLLPKGAVSRWHRVQSDEVWHYYEGAPLDLWIASARFDATNQRRLGSLSGSQQQVLAVPAGSWQAARSRGVFTLVGCTVGPGFEFADFTLAASVPEAIADLRRHHPALEEFL
jgi:predicted cupin superfamily sugar epimerase